MSDPYLPYGLPWYCEPGPVRFCERCGLGYHEGEFNGDCSHPGCPEIGNEPAGEFDRDDEVQP